MAKRTNSTTALKTFHTLLVFRCPTALSEALGKRAIEQHTSISGVIRELLQEGLKKS